MLSLRSTVRSRVAAVIRKEFIQIRRDRRTLAIVLALPVMQLLLFGYAINTVVDHISMIVFDESGDADSRALVAAFVNSSYFDVVAEARSQEEITEALDAGQAKVGLHISPDFGDRVLGGQAGLVQMVIDGSDPNVAQTALFAGGAVAQAQTEKIIAERSNRISQSGSGAGIDLRPVVLYNPGMLSVNFMVPGIIGLILQFQTLLLTAFSVVRERERGTLEQLVVTPIKSWELMLGKILPYTVLAFIAATLALVAGTLLFGVGVSGNLALLALLSVIFLVGSLGVGLLISTISRTQIQAQQTAMFIILPSLLLSGFLYPRETMPFLVQQIGLLIPLTYYLDILRGVIIKGVGIAELWPSALPLALFGLGVFTLSVWRFQKRVG